MFQCQAFHFGIIQHFVFVQAVGNGVVKLAGNVHARAVGQVSTVCEAHAQNGVARFQHAGVHRLVGLTARVRLHVHVFCVEEFFAAVNCQLFGNVHMFAAAVIAFVRITFVVFVGQLAALGFHHGAAHIVFRSNQFDVVLLALVFGGDGGGELGVVFGDGEAFGRHGGVLYVGRYGKSGDYNVNLHMGFQAA